MSKNLKHIRRIQKRIVLLVLVLGSSLSYAKDRFGDDILATVGNKKITISEFKARCELTVRPENFKDKSTALNNIIIEKILALEAEKKHLLASHPGFQALLKGIKEQAMREKLLHDVAFKRATVDTNKLKNAYKLSIREYELEFYRMHKKLAQKVKAIIDSSSGTTDEIFSNLSEELGKQPIHKVNYKDPDNDAIHEALFSKPLTVGEVLGPVNLGSDDYLVMKVLNWTSYPLLSGIDQQERWKEVREKEHSIAAAKMWKSYRSKIMHGKKIEFDKKTFIILAHWVREKYISEQKQKDSTAIRMPEIPFDENGINLSSPFFTFENNIWTVGDFKKELMSRPFLFRTTNLDSASFNAEFRLAIVDIMEDHCLTREAYKRSLDKGEDITRTVEMWGDALMADNQQKDVIDTALKDGKVIEKDELGILKFWETHVHDLKNEYNNSIHINGTAFKNISLTNVQMYAVKRGLPYPSIVPNFPKYLSSDTLDYGMNEK